MDSDVAIQIWTRLTLPTRYKFLLERFETIDDLDPYDPGKIESVSFVIHMPARMLDDRVMDFHFDSERLKRDAKYWMERFYGPLSELIGTNALDRVEHPDNDGFFLVCSSV